MIKIRERNTTLDQFKARIQSTSGEDGITLLIDDNGEIGGFFTNEPAVALYKKMGFKIEGIKEKSMIVDGNYVDEYYMGKLI